MTRYQVAYAGHVTLKVAAAGEGVVVVEVVAPKAEVVAPKAEAGVDPAESGRERRQVQERSRIDDRIVQSEKEYNPHVCCG